MYRDSKQIDSLLKNKFKYWIKINNHQEVVLQDMKK